MKVVVTGGAGYVGAELVAALSMRRDLSEIVVYDNLSRGSHGLITGPRLGPVKVRCVVADLLDSRRLRRELSGAGAVFHLAAKVSTPHAIHGHHYLEQVNHWGTAELVLACEETAPSALLVYPSTTAVYGPGEEHAAVRSVPNPESEYGRSKLRGESHVLRFGERGRGVVVRLANVYGLGRCVRFDAVINRFSLDARLAGRIQIAGDGTQRRSFIHVEDAATTLASLLDHPIDSGVYDLAGSAWSILDIADALNECGGPIERLFVEQHRPLVHLTVDRDARLAAAQPKAARVLKTDLQSLFAGLNL